MDIRKVDCIGWHTLWNIYMAEKIREKLQTKFIFCECVGLEINFLAVFNLQL
jgi:hypothetical protein